MNAEKAKLDFQSKEIAMFWKLLPTVLQRAPPNSTLQDLARLEYSVAETIHPSDWTDPENLVMMAMILIAIIYISVLCASRAN